MKRPILQTLTKAAQLVDAERDDIVEAFIAGSRVLGDDYANFFGVMPLLVPGYCRDPERRVAVAMKLLKHPGKLYAMDLEHMATMIRPAFYSRETCYSFEEIYAYPVPLWMSENITEGLVVDDFDMGEMTGLEKKLIKKYANMDMASVLKEIKRIGKEVFSTSFISSAYFEP